MQLLAGPGRVTGTRPRLECSRPKGFAPSANKFLLAMRHGDASDAAASVTGYQDGKRRKREFKRQARLVASTQGNFPRIDPAGSECLFGQLLFSLNHQVRIRVGCGCSWLASADCDQVVAG